MAADSDGDLIETVLTCEGDLKDPAFAQKFDRIVTRLRKLVCTGEGESLRVAKVEPWNSVRVTFTIPREAALRLRRLAQEGNAALTALGILSVQVEGDQVISLRIAGPCGTEPREIVLRTAASSSVGPDNAIASTSSAPDPVVLPVAPIAVAPPPPVGAQPPQFRSPNVVAPSDGDPIPPIPPPAGPGATPATSTTPGAAAGGPFPFASMTHAAHAMRDRPAVAGSPTYRAMQGYTTSASSSPAPPPPPYPSSPAPTTAPPALAYPSKPGGRPDVALSSPLLVNLLQNDAGSGGSAAGTKMPPPPPGAPEKPVRARPANKKAVVRRRPDGTVLSESPGKVASAFANVPQSDEVLSRLSPSTGFPAAPDLPAVSFSVRQPTAGPRHVPPPSQSAGPGRQYPGPGPGPQPPPYSNRLPNQQQMLLQQQQLQQQRLLQQRMLQHQQQQQQQLTLSETKPYGMATNAMPPANAAPSSDFSRYPANGNGTNAQWTRGPAPFTTAAPPPTPTYSAPTAEVAAVSPPPLTSAGKHRQLLINPLTGHLEPMASESSSDSEPEPAAAAPDAGTPDDPFFYFPSPLNDRSNSMFSDDDDDVSSTLSRRADTTTTTDQSDSEATVRSTASEASSSRGHHRKRDRSPAAGGGGEKIKLRLKLDKGEPAPAAYKVDVSFAAARKGSARPEEPRVPPLHISLRGRAAVVVSSRKKYVPPKDGPSSPTAKKRPPPLGPDGQPIKTKGSKSSANSVPRPRKPGSASSGKTKSGEPRIDGKPRVKPKLEMPKEMQPVMPAIAVEENAVKEERKISPNKAKRRDARKRTAEGPQREQNLLSGGRILDGQFRGSGRGGHSKGGGHSNARRREVARRGSEGEVKVEENGVGSAGDKRRRQSCPDDKDLSFTDTQGVPSSATKPTAAPTPTPPPVAVVPSAAVAPRVHNAHAKPGGKSKHPAAGAVPKPHRDDNCLKRNDAPAHDAKRNCAVDVEPTKKVPEDVVKVLDVLDAITRQRMESIEACKQRLLAASTELQRIDADANKQQRHMEVAEINALGLDVTVTEVVSKGRSSEDNAKKRLADAAAATAKQRIEITEVSAKGRSYDDIAKNRLLDAAAATAKQRVEITEVNAKRPAEIVEANAKPKASEVSEFVAKQRLVEAVEVNAKQRLLDTVEVNAKQRMMELADAKAKQRVLETSEANAKQKLLEVAEVNAKQRLLEAAETNSKRTLEISDVNSKKRLLEVAETKQRLLDVADTKQRLLEVAETKQRSLDVSESKQRLIEAAESKQRLLEVAETKQRLLDAAETKQRLAAVEEANAKQRLLESSESKRLVEETSIKQRQSPETKEANGEAGNTQGEDSGIESMDALSEKSPNQGESPGRKDDTPPAAPTPKAERREENESKPPAPCAESSHVEPAPTKTEPDDITPSAIAEPPAPVVADDDRECDSPPLVVNRSTKAKPLPASASSSPSPDDPQPIRITPPLYTYSNPEKHRDETPSPGALLLDDEEDGRATARRKEEMRRKRKRKQELEGRTEPSDDGEEGARFLDGLGEKAVSKSLLEQLLIEIPVDEGKRGRSTRSSSLKTPRSSPLVRDDNGSKLSPLVRSKRKRQESESSAASSLAPDCADHTTTTAPPPTTGGNAPPRPGKRKCSENAAELIKACMGLDESPAKKPGGVAPVVAAPVTPTTVGTGNALVDGRRMAGKARKAGACATLVDADSSEDDEPLIDLKTRPTPAVAAAAEDTTPRHRTPRVSVPTAKMAAALGKESTPRRSGRQAPRTPLATPKTRAKPAHPATPTPAIAQVAATAVVAPPPPTAALPGDEENNRRKTRSAGPSVETEGVNKSTRRRPSRDGK